MDSVYFLDNNVVSHLSREQLRSPFFADCCRVPDEVLHEANERSELRPALYPTTAQVLDALREVMSTVDPTDTSLVDLYANKGNADPLLIACAVCEVRRADVFLVKPTIVIVSNDAAVRAKAAEFGIPHMTREEFLSSTTGDWGAR